MFSRHQERQSADDRATRDDQRIGGSSVMPSTGMRDAVAMPISSAGIEPAMYSTAPAHTAAESIIGKDDQFEGTLRVQHGLRVLGKVDGEIEASTSVTIEEGAKVDAGLSADEAIIAGEYSGKLVCRQRLEIRSTGRVKGEIETVRLMLHEGGFIDGALHMQKPAASGSAASTPGSDSSRTGDALRSGISPRSTADSISETPATEPDREHAAAGVRSSTTGSTGISSR